MHFAVERPLEGLVKRRTPIWDAHVHLWDGKAFAGFDKWCRIYGVTKITGIASPAVKTTLEQAGQAANITFAYYLPTISFADHDTESLLKSVNEAHAGGYSVVKMWFGPRFLDYAKSEKEFSIDHPSFEPVFSLIEDYGLSLDIHVADPDYWYQTKYHDTDRYRTKNQAIREFTTILARYPLIKVIGVHFGSLPENLNQLAGLLDRYPNFYVDTASTKWIIRELGHHDRVVTREFIIKYKDRILFATDLSVGRRGGENDYYYSSRFWSQRLFWETRVRNVILPFPDNDNQNGQTLIKGISLPEKVLDCLYWKNARRFFT